MSTQLKTYISPEEYLEIERKAERKSEYYAGEMFLMAGASRKHNLLVSNLIIAVGSKLRGGDCNIYPSDLRVFIPRTGSFTYPDVIVTCGEEKFLDNHFDTLLNPLIVFEVLSHSTERFDRGGKFDHYREIESLREYVLVAQDRVMVEHYSRQANGKWLLTAARKLSDAVRLEAVECELPVRDVYAKLDVSEGFVGSGEEAGRAE